MPNSLFGKSHEDYEEVIRDEYMEPITQITQINYPQMSQISIVDDRDCKSPQTQVKNKKITFQKNQILPTINMTKNEQDYAIQQVE